MRRTSTGSTTGAATSTNREASRNGKRRRLSKKRPTNAAPAATVRTGMAAPVPIRPIVPIPPTGPLGRLESSARTLLPRKNCLKLSWSSERRSRRSLLISNELRSTGPTSFISWTLRGGAGMGRAGTPERPIPRKGKTVCSSPGAGGVAAPTSVLADYIDLGRVGPVFAVVAAEIAAVHLAMACLVTASSTHFLPPGTNASFRRSCKPRTRCRVLSPRVFGQRSGLTCNFFR